MFQILFANTVIMMNLVWHTGDCAKCYKQEFKINFIIAAD